MLPVRRTIPAMAQATISLIWSKTHMCVSFARVYVDR